MKLLAPVLTANRQGWRLATSLSCIIPASSEQTITRAEFFVNRKNVVNLKSLLPF